jgi:hypothetical protein
MNRKFYPVVAGLVTAVFLLVAACGTTPTAAPSGDGGGQVVEVTRIVEVTVEVPVEGTPTTTEVQVPVTFAEAGNTLQTVMDRGRLICGGNASVPGFGYLDPETQQFTGFDIDSARPSPRPSSTILRPSRSCPLPAPAASPPSSRARWTSSSAIPPGRSAAIPPWAWTSSSPPSTTARA